MENTKKFAVPTQFPTFWLHWLTLPLQNENLHVYKGEAHRIFPEKKSRESSIVHVDNFFYAKDILLSKTS